MHKTLDGVCFYIQDRLLNIEVPSYLALDLADRLTKFISRMARRAGEYPQALAGDRTDIEKDRTALELVHLMRAARMVYELHLHQRITSIDRHDAEILYGLDLEVSTEWLNSILNQTRWGLLRTDLHGVLVADSIMKSLEEIMSS